MAYKTSLKIKFLGKLLSLTNKGKRLKVKDIGKKLAIRQVLE